MSTTATDAVLADAVWIAARFAEVWAEPQLDRFVALLHEDVCLRQPVTPIVRGREASREEFRRLLRWLPDLRGSVDSWSVGDDGQLLIAWRLVFTLGGSPFELRIVDRIVVCQRLIIEREAYFDSLRFLLATLRRPRAWLGYLRYRGYLPGG